MVTRGGPHIQPAHYPKAPQVPHGHTAYLARPRPAMFVGRPPLVGGTNVHFGKVHVHKLRDLSRLSDSIHGVCLI